MKYLFFDIECANSFKGVCKMCSFGYAITNDKLEVLESKDIIMDPEDKFDWYLVSKKNSKAKLAYKPDYYRLFQSFPYHYNEIKRILTDEYGGIFGYAVNNDLKYIVDSTTRYSLPEIKVQAYDLHEMLVEYDNISKGLANSLKELTDKEYRELTNHNSEHDAIMTSKLLKNICNKLDVSLKDYLELSEIEPKTYHETIKVKKLKIERSRRVKVVDPEVREKNDLLNTYYDKENENPSNSKYKGLIYSVSSEIKKDIDLALKLVTHIYDGSGVMTRPDGEYETLIILNEKDKKRLTSKVDLTKVSFVLIDKYIKT